jgi:hypothetical protein
MKLATFILAGLLGATSIASADDLPGQDSDDGDYYAPPGATAEVPPAPPAPPARPMRGQRGQRGAKLRQLIMERFDRNGDGRLEPRERRQAARALRRIAKRLGQRGNTRQRLIQKYDLDGDGNLGPGELPPRIQQRLRRFDRNGDGWVDQGDRRAPR